MVPNKLQDKALLKAKSAKTRQVTARSAVSGRMTKVPTVGIQPKATRKKATPKPAPAAPRTPITAAPEPTGVTLTGRSGLIGFFRSGRGDLSQRAKDIARGRDT